MSSHASPARRKRSSEIRKHSTLDPTSTSGQPTHHRKARSRRSAPRHLLQRQHVKLGVALAAVAATIASAAALQSREGFAATASTTPPSAVTIYPASTVPAHPSDNDSQAVDLGVRFTVHSAGTIVGLRYYKSTANTGQHVGTLWSASRAKLASVVFTGESSSGWQTATFDRPVAIAPNVAYVASYHTSTGHYADQQDAFGSGRTLGNSQITATAGLYHYGTQTAYPTSTWNASAYFVDVLFLPSTVSTSTTPTQPAPSTTMPSSAPTSSASSSSSSTASSPASSTPAPSTTASSPATSSSSTTTPTTAPPASTGGFPTAATTGVPAGTVLKSSVNASGTGWSGDSNGNVTVSAGATASGLDVRGKVVLQAGATLKNSRVRCIGEDSFCVTMNARTTLQDSEVGGGADGVTYGYAAGIWTGDFDSTTARNLILRDNIHSLTRAVQNDGQTTVQDSYFHDSVYDCAYHDTIPTAGNQQCGLHSSASFMSKGHGITYQHNTLQDGSTAVLFGQVYDNDGSTLGNVTINDNRIRATREPNGYTSSFGVSIEYKHIDNPASIRITNNVFDASPWDVGEYRNDCPTGPASCYTVSGNSTVPSGSAINP